MKTGLFLENKPPQILSAKCPTGIHCLVHACFFLLFTNACGQSTFPGSAAPQTAGSQYKLLFTLDIEATCFTTDKLQNIYYISRKNEVVKLKPDGTEEFRYINKTLGEPVHIDATDPFNLLLFYPDYQNVITLDRTMNLAGQFNLFDLGLFGVDAVGMAGDGNLWLYDALTFRLKKIGKDGVTISQSSDLSLELNQFVKPNFLLERDQEVFLNDPNSGIMVFDVFGKHLKTLPLLGLDRFQVIGDQLLFFKEGQLHSFHLKALLQSPVLLPEGVLKENKIWIDIDRLYVLGSKKLEVYQY